MSDTIVRGREMLWSGSGLVGRFVCRIFCRWKRVAMQTAVCNVAVELENIPFAINTVIREMFTHKEPLRPGGSSSSASDCWEKLGSARDGMSVAYSAMTCGPAIEQSFQCRQRMMAMKLSQLAVPACDSGPKSGCGSVCEKRWPAKGTRGPTGGMRGS